MYPAVARAGLGEIALRDGRFSEAVQYLEAALDRAPDAASVHYSLGMAYRGLGRLDQARSHLARRGTSGLRPADPVVDALAALLRGERAQMILGRRAYEAGQFKEATAAFRKALESAHHRARRPVSVWAWPWRRWATSPAPPSSSKRPFVSMPITPRPMRRSAWCWPGRAGTVTRSSICRAAFRREPSDEVSGVLIRLLLKQSRGDEALEVLSRTRSFTPDDEGTVLGLAILLADRERYRDAIELLESASRELPDRVRTATTLARLLAASPDRSLRDGARALALATRVYEVERSATHGESVALALAELGRCRDAATWMQRSIAEADRAGDAGSVARLRSEAPRYAADSCRP